MDVNNTAYNEYVLCSDCEYGLSASIFINDDYTCPRWGTKVKNVGLCKYYKRNQHADTRDQ